MSRDFFNKAAENTVQLEKQIMPEPYKYYKFIKTPKEMGMSTKGGMKDLQNNLHQTSSSKSNHHRVDWYLYYC